MRRALSVATLGVCLLSCGGRDAIRIGLLVSVSGRNHDMGVSCRNGAQLAVEQVNAAGGVGGEPLELVMRNDAQDPGTARRAMAELLAAGVVAVIGPDTSAVAEAVLPVADREGILLVSPTVSTPRFSGKDDWLVLLRAGTAAAAEELARRPGRDHQAVAVVHDRTNGEYTEYWRGRFQARLAQDGGRVVAEVPFSPGLVGSFGGLAEHVLASRPDAVVIVANALDTAALAQQLRRRAPAIALMASGWASTPALLEHGGAAVEGLVLPLEEDPDDRSPSDVRFRQAYLARFGRSEDFAARGSFEAVQLLAAALPRDATRPGLRRQVLAMGHLPDLDRDLAIDRNGDVHRAIRLAVVRQGAYHLVP